MNVSLVLHDHLVHFYHLHGLDWCDITQALKADPKKASELAFKYVKNPWAVTRIENHEIPNKKHRQL